MLKLFIMPLAGLIQRFHKYFTDSLDVIAAGFAPGRINLIGEHTDYNGGLVLPCGISMGTYLVIGRNRQGCLRFVSSYYPEILTVLPSAITQRHPAGWVNYPLGIINELIDYGLQVEGLDFYYEGDLPLGAGLSSSASIEMVTAACLNHVAGLSLDMAQLVMLSRKAENEFVGVNCGIMDQYAVAWSKKDHALLINCLTLVHEAVPFSLNGYRLVIADTSKSRELAASAYNQRVAECQKAVKYLSKYKAISLLGELSYQEFVGLAHHIPDLMIRKRAQHVVSENQRVADAVKALRAGNLKQFGSLMIASHQSLKHCYEVTGVELDVMVQEALKHDGVIGARMTGAGFGGCAIVLVRDDQVNSVINAVSERYGTRTGLKPKFYLTSTSDGVTLFDIHQIP